MFSCLLLKKYSINFLMITKLKKLCIDKFLSPKRDKKVQLIKTLKYLSVSNEIPFPIISIKFELFYFYWKFNNLGSYPPAGWATAPIYFRRERSSVRISLISNSGYLEKYSVSLLMKSRLIDIALRSQKLNCSNF